MQQTVYQQDIENYFVSWEEVNHAIDTLVERLKPQGWQQIVALTEGGVGPAAGIARALDLPLIEALKINDNSVQSNLEGLNQHIDASLQTLFVDDLVDTGKTARAAKAAFPNAHFVALYAKPSGEPYVDDFANALSDDAWAHFPWDVLVPGESMPD